MKRDHVIQRGIQNRSEQGGPWEDLGLQKPTEEGQGPAWAGEVDQRRPARGPVPGGVSWRGPINWGLFGPKRARKGYGAVGPRAPRGGPPIAAALSGSGKGREAPDDGSPGVSGGGPELVREDSASRRRGQRDSYREPPVKQSPKGDVADFGWPVHRRRRRAQAERRRLDFYW